MHKYLFMGTPFKMLSWDFLFLFGLAVCIIWSLIRKPKDFEMGYVELFLCEIFMVFTGLVGAKLFYIFLHWDFLTKYATSFIGIFQFAGRVYLGALVFSLIGIFVFTQFRINRRSFFKTGDYLAPFMVLHQLFVRIGCFMNGCCYGTPTDLPWGCAFPKAKFVYSHPTQIYSVFMLGVIFIVVRVLYCKKNLPMGVLSFLTLALYGFFRFFLEFLRADSFPGWGIFTFAQITLFIIIAIGLLGVLFINRILQGGNE